VHGPAHSSIGQEGGAVGSVLALAPGDTVNGSHRGHHQFLAKALSHVAPDGIDPTLDFSDAVRAVVLRTLAEICGLDRGFSHGRGGSMHLQWKEAGAIGTNAIVGGGVPLAAGSAFAHRQAGTDAVSVTYFGDGAANIGSTLESLNLTAAWKLPLCFFIENNGYAVSTSVKEATGEPRLSARGPGFGMKSYRVDGMNVLATYLTMKDALAHMREGSGPTLVEADVYRYFHQNGSFPGSAFRYRTREEEQSYRERDPIAQLTAQLVRRSVLTEDQAATTIKAAKDLMLAVGAELLEPLPNGKPGQRQLRPREWPDPEFVDVGVRGDLSEFDDATYAELNTVEGGTKPTKFIDAVSRVMDRRMSTDASILILGEDVHRLNGGTNGATKGLKEAFPDRVLGTPISENAFTGLGGGLALDGRYKPVVEFMYADFMWVAADQLFNQIGKARHMFGGDDAVPFVLRSKVAMGTGYGSQHSMDPAGVFATAAGWRIVAPSTPFDYVGLMNSALRCKDPVVVLEHVDLYQSSGEGPIEDWDYCIEVGKAAIRREGRELTIITYLGMTSYVLDAVEAAGVDADVIDLRWLDRASLDWDAIGRSVRKTNYVMIAEQGPLGTSYGSWLADEIQRRLFDWLDGPIERVTGREASPSISKVLERAAIAQAREVEDALANLRKAVDIGGRSA
jgi:2-oxoisovalerate dehydrogenase E1 component